ncbi:MAG: GNAT family protein [Paucibacter sp.]|nr:GNAT family protein [Roseateles sp.]
MNEMNPTPQDISPMQIQPLRLQGRVVCLEPLDLARHLPGLCAVGLDPELWQWVPTQVRSEAQMRAYVETALEEQARGSSLPFAIRSLAEDRVIGCTRFGNISPRDHRLEIGWTWLGRAWQRSGANTEAKTLLLTHAFETLGAWRVELKTDALNAKSRAAIARIGAQQEGILRRHTLTDTGRVRDTVYFSVLDQEWPAVKARLQAMLC